LPDKLRFISSSPRKRCRESLRGQTEDKKPAESCGSQDFIQQAIGKITDAQKANNYDMKGHTARAKQLLEEAYRAIWLAAQAANAAQQTPNEITKTSSLPKLTVGFLLNSVSKPCGSPTIVQQAERQGDSCQKSK